MEKENITNLVLENELRLLDEAKARIVNDADNKEDLLEKYLNRFKRVNSMLEFDKNNKVLFESVHNN